MRNLQGGGRVPGWSCCGWWTLFDRIGRERASERDNESESERDVHRCVCLCVRVFDNVGVGGEWPREGGHMNLTCCSCRLRLVLRLEHIFGPLLACDDLLLRDATLRWAGVQRQQGHSWHADGRQFLATLRGVAFWKSETEREWVSESEWVGGSRERE